VFSKNLRLIGAGPEEIAFAKLLDAISVGDYSEDPERTFVVCDGPKDEAKGEQSIVLRGITPFTNDDDTINFLHPDGFNTQTMGECAIIASTNARVDYWNNKVQLLNLNPTHSLMSKDILDQCDDPHDYLKKMMTPEVLSKFNTNDIPPHQLDLKVGDICILLRNFDREVGLTSNCRVRILQISHHVVRVQTLDDAYPITASLPRLTFKAQLPYGRSFTISRRQFPLKLCYSITVNRSQGCTLSKVVVDTSVEMFSHGALFVALSRIRMARNLAIFCLMSALASIPGVTVQNVVYKELLG
jgi:ATP-dependent DNA helicase PIF1